VDRIGADFYGLHEQLTAGLQVLLELHDVSLTVRGAVRDYIGDVVKDLVQMEAGVVRLADVPGAPEAGYVLTEPLEPGMDPTEHGHTTMSALFEEIRRDEAMKREQSPASDKESLQKILSGKAEPAAPEPTRENNQGIER
jgi:hypothetical protein